MDAHLGRYLCAKSIPFSNDNYLWSTFDVSVGLDDSFEQPSDDVVFSHLENRFQNLNNRCSYYTSWHIPRRDALMGEMYELGVRFNREKEK